MRSSGGLGQPNLSLWTGSKDYGDVLEQIKNNICSEYWEATVRLPAFLPHLCSISDC
jgi:hypothetical protein